MPVVLTMILCKNDRMAKLDGEDLKAIKELMQVTIEEAIEEKGLVTKSDLSHLPTKDEFYEQTGEILKRLDNLEIEKDLLSNRVSEHSDQLEKIGKALRQSSN